MPRTKKPAGQAVDRRNGRRLELANGGGLDWLQLPARRPAWSPVAYRALELLRADPVSTMLQPVDEPVVIRWLDCLERAASALRRADRSPLVVGGNGQLTEHPSYQTAKTMLAEAAKCEAQIGVGALNRAKLGIETASAVRSLEDLNRALTEGDEDDYDPRLG